MKNFKLKSIVGLACALVLTTIMFSSVPAPRDRECRDCNGYNWTCTGAQRCEQANYLECSDCDFKCGYYVSGTIIWGEEHDCEKVF